MVGALAAGVPIVPINPKSGSASSSTSSPTARRTCVLGRRPVRSRSTSTGVRLVAGGEPDDEAPAIVVYTSGTTGPPKGVVLPRRAIATNLDALADAWAWTGDDVVAHGLPLFHVHGLILGVLGPLRRGGGAWHLGRFSSEAAGDGAGGPRDDAVRRADDVPPARGGPRGVAVAGGRGRAARGCWCPAPPRCRPPTTSASRRRAGWSSSSATG